MIRQWLSGPRLRRIVQLSFLTLFILLVIWARPLPDRPPSPWLKLFFWFDPLILVVTSLAAHAVPWLALLALVTGVVTVLGGRLFCGWVCPLGTVHDIAGRFLHSRRPRRGTRDWWSGWQRTKHYLLVAFLVMALFGGHWVTIFDPLVLLYRTLTVSVFPTVQWAVEEGSTAIYQTDPGIGPVRVVHLTEPLYVFYRDNITVKPRQAFWQSGSVLVFFAVIVGLNAVRRRWWCRFVCPLGALLGFLAWRPFLRRELREDICNQCELCGLTCHGAAAEAAGGKWKASECFGCLNCTEACHRDSLQFRWVWPWKPARDNDPVDLSRRGVLASVLGGLFALGAMRSTVLGRQLQYPPELIRPPGARPEPEFLARCTACALCMKVCPTGGLQPCGLEMGLESLWTPRLVPQIGYCDYGCNRCGFVCPTEAIRPLPLIEKQQTRLGLATFDTSRCIPYAYGRDCMVCEEHCPIPDKAIYFLEVEITDRQGQKRLIKRPYVDATKCIGCGVCESVCVFRDRPAIRVTSANESRNSKNQPIPAWEEPYY